MLLQDGTAVLPVTAPVMGQLDTVHPVLIWDNRNAVLIDTGFPKQLDQLQNELARYKVSLTRLSHVLITHQDIDHIGGLPELLSAASEGRRPEVLAHPLEKPYIQGDRRLLRFTDEAIASVDRMPESVPESFKSGLKALMLNPPAAPVSRTVSGGNRLELCGGILVVDTPGHTPGHISFYHEPTRTLIAGDALTVRGGELHGPDRATTLNAQQATLSLQQLTGLPIEAVVCYHGGVWRGNARRRLTELASFV